jgi:hypothetical protein
MYSTKSITSFSKFSMCHLSRLSIVLLTWQALGYSERVRKIGADWPKFRPQNSKMTEEKVSGRRILLPICSCIDFSSEYQKRGRLLQSLHTFSFLLIRTLEKLGYCHRFSYLYIVLKSSENFIEFS